MTSMPDTLTAPPLVSVLIRSSARLTLARALDSAAEQSIRGLTIHVVAASGPTHPALPPTWRGVPLTLHRSDSALPRAVAANRLLDAVDTEYCAFLDDDDEWLPGHLQPLIQQLQRTPSAPYAFSQAHALDGEGNLIGTLGRPFHAIELALQNPLAFNSLVIRTDYVRRLRIRFDDTLDRLAETDFLMQLSSRGATTVFMAAPTAIWNAPADAVAGKHRADAGAEANEIAERLQELSTKWKTHIDRWMNEPQALLSLARVHLRTGSQKSAEMLLYRLAKTTLRSPQQHHEFVALCQLAGVVVDEDTVASRDPSDAVATDNEDASGLLELTINTAPPQNARTGQNR